MIDVSSMTSLSGLSAFTIEVGHYRRYHADSSPSPAWIFEFLLALGPFALFLALELLADVSCAVVVLEA